MSSEAENLVVEVRFRIEKDSDGYPKSRDSEALLCKPLDPECSLCVVESVPFYLRNVAYGDTIGTEENASGMFQFKQVMKRGGYSVYRLFLHDPSQKDEAIRTLLRFNVLLEQSGNLIAFAVPQRVDIDEIFEYVLEGKRKGFWGTQDGFIFEGS